MKKISALLIFLALLSTICPQTPQKPQEQPAPEDVIRITTNLVQTDLVVTDKNDQVIKDLKLEDFELLDNGKKQDIKFMEFVGVDTATRVEGAVPALPRGVQPDLPSSGVATQDLKRVVAFVVDDLTIASDDMSRVRDLLTGFVDNQMLDGDLVAIVRVVGGSGLLQQFSADKQLLRRAIQNLTPKSHPFAAGAPGFTAADVMPQPAGETPGTNEAGVSSGLDAEAQTDDVNKGFRDLIGLSVTNSLITSMKSIPGRKSVVLFSGGLPLYDVNDQGTVIDRSTGETLPVDQIRPLYGDMGSLIRNIVDNASRSGVVVHTMDVRGLEGAAKFKYEEAKSALGMTVGSQSVGGGGENPGFGRTPGASIIPGPETLAGAEGLRWLANSTGGIASINTNNFRAGLDKILTRSQGYYVLGYTPSEKFDAKFHKISVKVRRDGTHVYARTGYIAREDQIDTATPVTKEDKILKAAMSPLTKTQLGVSTLVQHKFLPDGKAQIDINLFIDPKTLHFTQSSDGKYQDSFDVAGFVFDHTGRLRGGFSNTVTPILTPEQFKDALAAGLTDAAHTELPPGYFELRVVVRENETGRIGTTSRYLEVPNISRKQLTMSSLFLFSVPANQTSNAGAVPLQAQRRVSRSQDLRYAAVIYNPKVSGGQQQLRTQTIVSQRGKVLLQEPEQPVSGPLSGIQVIKIGQLGLSRVPPGQYVLTVITTDPAADKKSPRTISRSIDFTVVN